LQQLGLVQPMNATVSNANTCNSITSSHGAGRQNGFATNFLSTGCSNWRGYSYTYGATNIPFFINTAGMSTARISDIRAQVEMWNQTVMHDGTGQIVNIYEVDHTNNINGRPVIVVSQSTTLGSGIAGLFTGSPTAPTIQLAASMNVDTPVHEFGHLLGLNDIDSASGSTSGTHPVLMGYSRGTTTSTLSSAIKYQDIQGIARVNGRHTTHQFSRFVMNGSRYIYFCFYCDTIDDRASALSGSAAMETASNCTHTYQQMVSQGSRHWLKCTKCYKVTESDRIMVQGLTSTTLKVTGAIGTISGSFVIPSMLDGQSVTEIGASAFSGQNQLSQITIPASITTIGANAFHNNTSVYWLNNYAFRDNIFLESLNGQTEFTIPDIIAGKTVTQIENYAFAGSTTLTKVTIPSSVAYIGDHAFSNCTSLSQVEISDETTSILGSTPFSGCTQLYGTILSIKTDYHRIIDGTGRLIWMAHDFVYDNHHSSTHHDLVCQSCGHEDTKTHNKQVVNGIEVCSTCPWVGDVHTNHEHTHAYIPIPHSGKFPVNKHKAYCYCGLYIEEMCLGRIAEDGKAYCIYCGRDMTGALGPILNKMLLPKSELHDHDIYCIEDYQLDNCCTIKNEIYSSEPNNVLYMHVKRRERNFYDRISYKGR